MRRTRVYDDHQSSDHMMQKRVTPFIVISTNYSYYWLFPLRSNKNVMNVDKKKFLEHCLNVETIQFFKIVLNIFVMQNIRFYHPAIIMITLVNSDVVPCRSFRHQKVPERRCVCVTQTWENIIIIQTLWAGLPASLRSEDGQKHTLTESSRSDAD